MRLADQASVGWDGLSNQSHPGAKALVMRPTGRNGASNRVYPFGHRRSHETDTSKTVQHRAVGHTWRGV